MHGFEGESKVKSLIDNINTEKYFLRLLSNHYFSLPNTYLKKRWRGGGRDRGGEREKVKFLIMR